MLQDFITIENNHANTLAVSLDQIKQQCDVYIDEIDELFTRYLLTSQKVYEETTNDILFTRKISCIETKPERSNMLTIGPIQSIDSVYAVNSSFGETLIDPDRYTSYEGKKTLLQVKSYVPWRLKFNLTVGYASIEEIPLTAIQAIILRASTMYQYRGDIAENNPGKRASDLLMNHTSRKRGRFE
ncbi:hypothetical protein KS4_18150 [Poriferisphaera corsica]|uniref:Phage gp6-like head-tail connector protein n=1 Tax=Poriferisphaera corsica TaxID=2528020 RepID=A0A517YU49_9BACT|nr:hypothetical protein [Poriferisphaera corsica]QDU33758.1 hypothetical protein KS4_18150 [Poriferisphaera corsica]